MTATLSDRSRARLALVEEHVRRENAQDLPAIMATFGRQARYDDEPWGEHHEGRDAVQRYLEILLAHPLTVARAYARKLRTQR